MTEVPYLEANRAMWDERVGIHVGSAFYDNAGFIAGRDALRPFELTEVGDVRGKSLVHLQCHFGQDTLSWARHGATVTGLDFSGEAVGAARKLAADVGVSADFVQSDVYDAVQALGRRQFDIVYTGFGAIIWLPDIYRWARVCAELVKPGGFLYLAEFHPVTWMFGWDEFKLSQDYFFEGPLEDDEPGSYTDPGAATKNNLSYEWHHQLGDIVSAVAAAGMHIEFLHEHDFTLYQQWSILERHSHDAWRMPQGQPRIPLMFSLRASKPG
jgi:SAM-dependent methyltransferase